MSQPSFDLENIINYTVYKVKRFVSAISEEKAIQACVPTKPFFLFSLKPDFSLKSLAFLEANSLLENQNHNRTPDL